MSEEPDDVSIRAHFERFPATIKGAFVVRGEDRDPHQVAILSASVVPVATGRRRPLELAPVTLDVAPKIDLFVPFELSVTEFEPGWYGLECDVEVDGVRRTMPTGKRFAVAWPRATVRRGNLPVGKEIVLAGGGRVRVDQVECGGDSMKLSLVAQPAGPLDVRLSADGDVVPLLEEEADPETGRIRLVAFPVMRSHSALRIELAPRGTKARDRASLEVPLG